MSSPRAAAWARLRRHPLAVVGGVVVLFMVLCAVFSGFISAHLTRFTFDETHLSAQPKPVGARSVPEHHPRLQRVAFIAVDADQDGQLSPSELSAAVNQAAGAALFPEREAEVFINSYDRDTDQRLSPHEFKGLPLPATHWFGTDELGRDLATRVVMGARVSLLVGLIATSVSLFIGVLWGAIAGALGGWIDALMMRVVDVLYGLPFLFLVILLMVLFDGVAPFAKLLLIFFALGAVQWLTMSRVVRGQVLSLKNQAFVEAARALGLGTPTIILRHLIPNAMGPIIVYATLTVPAVMLEEAFLSFLGLGVQAPYTSWGALAADGATSFMEYPWLIIFPGGALAITLLALNLLGDGLRDALDPRLE